VDAPAGIPSGGENRRDTTKRILSITLLLTWIGVGYGNEEISVELLDGATMEWNARRRGCW